MQAASQKKVPGDWEGKYREQVRRNKRIIRDMRKHFSYIVLLIIGATVVLLYRLVVRPGVDITQTHFGNPDAYGIFWGVAALMVFMVIIAPLYLGLVSRAENWKLRYGIWGIVMIGFAYLVISLYDDVRNVWRNQELQSGFLIGIIGVIAWACSLKLIYIMVKGDTHAKFFRCLAYRPEVDHVEPLELVRPTLYDEDAPPSRSRNQRNTGSSA